MNFYEKYPTRLFSTERTADGVLPGAVTLLHFVSESELFLQSSTDFVFYKCISCLLPPLSMQVKSLDAFVRANCQKKKGMWSLHLNLW